MHVLEQRHLPGSFQNGFCKGSYTIDAVVKVNNEVGNTQKIKELMAVVYFDIEKAYDSTWKEGLLIKLSKMGYISSYSILITG